MTENPDHYDDDPLKELKLEELKAEARYKEAFLKAYDGDSGKTHRELVSELNRIKERIKSLETES